MLCESEARVIANAVVVPRPGLFALFGLVEAHSVSVAVCVGSLMGVAVCRGFVEFAHDDDTCRATVDTQRAACADVVVDGEDHLIVRVGSGLFGAYRFVDRVGVYHVDAFPWADIDTAFAHDAFGLVNVDELFRFDSCAEPGERQLVAVCSRRGIRALAGWRQWWS